MCPNNSEAGVKQPTKDRKSDAHAAQSSLTGTPSLQFISANGKSQISQFASVKIINLSTVPSFGTHCYPAFVFGNQNWIQHCMVDPGATINCVGYDLITSRFPNGTISSSVDLLNLLVVITLKLKHVCS